LLEFSSWLRARQLAPVISDLYSQASNIQQVELDKALRRLSHLDDRDKEVIRAMAYGITQKMLHKPVTRLKSAEEPTGHASAISHLFDISWR
jgi:glutamyl-tRNA reductase